MTFELMLQKYFADEVISRSYLPDPQRVSQKILIDKIMAFSQGLDALNIVRFLKHKETIHSCKLHCPCPLSFFERVPVGMCTQNFHSIKIILGYLVSGNCEPASIFTLRKENSHSYFKLIRMANAHGPLLWCTAISLGLIIITIFSLLEAFTPTSNVDKKSGQMPPKDNHGGAYLERFLSHFS